MDDHGQLGQSAGSIGGANGLFDPTRMITDNVGGMGLGSNLIVKKVSLGDAHTCVTPTPSSPRCFGAGEEGELGDGTLNNNYVTTNTIDLLSGYTTVKDVITGQWYTCVILPDDLVKCWGQNVDAYGILGRGVDTVRESLPPVKTVNLGLKRRAIALSAGFITTCVIRDDNEIKCWGNGGNGELGVGGTYYKRGIHPESYSCVACASGTNAAGDVKTDGPTTCDA